MPKQSRSYENECYQNHTSENASSKKCGIFYAQNLIEIKHLFLFFVNSSKSNKKQNQRNFMYQFHHITFLYARIQTQDLENLSFLYTTVYNNWLAQM